MGSRCLMIVGKIELSNDINPLPGIGNSILTTINSFVIKDSVNEVKLDITFLVVRERNFIYKAIIGNNILKQVDLVISEGEVEFRTKVKETKVPKSIEMKSEVKYTFLINLKTCVSSRRTRKGNRSHCL